MLSIKINGLEELLKKLDTKKNTLEEKMHKFMERLMEEGFEVAETGFKYAIYAGTNDVNVLEPQWEDDNTMVLVAEGDAVAFIEFGTGITYDYPDDYPTDKKQGIMARGTYGHRLGNLVGGWRYKGDPGNEGWVIRSGKHKGEVLTKGNPPARAMLNAGQTMRDKIKEIAKEVFKQ